MKKAKFLILGAGIQGVCIALELARFGYQVTILERDSSPLNRASLRNEGKVHLGLVYMNDATFGTPKLMLEGALSFRKNLHRWIHHKSYDLGLMIHLKVPMICKMDMKNYSMNLKRILKLMQTGTTLAQGQNDWLFGKTPTRL